MRCPLGSVVDMKGGFSNAETTREAFRGIRARPTGAILLALAAVALGAGTACWSLLELGQAANTYQTLRASGADTLAVRATSVDPLSSTRCDQLRQVNGIENAGGITATFITHPLQLPDADLTVVVGTPGFAALAFPREGGTASVVAGIHTAERFGLSAGDTFAFQPASGKTETLRIDVGATASSLVRGLDDALVIADAADSPLGECLVTAAPGARDSVAALLQDWFPQDNYTVVDQLREDSQRRDPEALLRERPSSLAPLGVGIALTAALTVWAALRREERALYRMLGMRRPQIVLGYVVESAILIWSPAAAGFAVALIALPIPEVSLVGGYLIRDWVALLATTAPAPLVATVIAMRFSPVDTVKGR